jgi:hypothetical protein
MGDMVRLAICDSQPFLLLNDLGADFLESQNRKPEPGFGFNGAGMSSVQSADEMFECLGTAPEEAGVAVPTPNSRDRTWDANWRWQLWAGREIPELCWINSDSALPLGGVARSAENRDDYDSLSFDREVDGAWEIGESTRGEFLNECPDIRKGDQRLFISRAKFCKKFKPKPWFLAFIPVECGFDISLNRRLGFDCISLHFDFRARRSITSNAGFAVEGFSR